MPSFTLPVECLERIVHYAANDHRVLVALMQTNSTLFRIATPYLYEAPFPFSVGDEFLQDWNTDAWTHHLRRVRHAQLLLLFLRCSAACKNNKISNNHNHNNNLNNNGNGLSMTGVNTASTDQCTQKKKDIKKKKKVDNTLSAQSPRPHQQQQQQEQQQHHSMPAWHKRLGKSVSSPSLRDKRRLQPPIHDTMPPLLRTILDSPLASGPLLAGSDALSSKMYINYLEYVKNLDLDTFLTSCLDIMFTAASSPAHPSTPACKRRHRDPVQHPHLAYSRGPLLERYFIEQKLLESTIGHLTTLSLSITSLVHLQHHLVGQIKHFARPQNNVRRQEQHKQRQGRQQQQQQDLSLAARSEPTLLLKMNRAGNKTGAPLSQLERLHLSGLDSELTHRVVAVLQVFLRYHAAAYPGKLTTVSFAGPGDSIPLRQRRQHQHQQLLHQLARRDVLLQQQFMGLQQQQHHINMALQQHPPQQVQHAAGVPAVESVPILHGDPTNDVQDGGNVQPDHEDEHEEEQGQAQGQAQGQGQGQGQEQVTVAGMTLQDILLQDSPAGAIQYMNALYELKDQLEVLDLSKWSWSLLRREELDRIPYARLTTLKFHPKTHIRQVHGPDWMVRFSKLQALSVQTFDPKMLDWAAIEAEAVLTTSIPTAEEADEVNLAETISSDGWSHGITAEKDSSKGETYPSGPGLRKLPMLQTLTLSGTVTNVLTVLQDAIIGMESTLTAIDLTAHLEDGFLESSDAQLIQSWPRSLTALSDHLTVLRLTDHLALSFQAPFLLETFTALTELSLSILTYTSSSFLASKAEHRVVPKIMTFRAKPSPVVSFSSGQEKCAAAQVFGLKVLQLEGNWVVHAKDLEEIGRRMPELSELCLMGCRFFGHEQEEAPSLRMKCSSRCHPVEALVQQLPRLRALKIHRRGIEGPLEDCESHQGQHDNPQDHGNTTRLPTREHVLEFKRRFPTVKVTVMEKQNGNSFVVPIQAPLLARLSAPTVEDDNVTTTGSGAWNGFGLDHGGVTLRPTVSLPDLIASEGAVVETDPHDSDAAIITETTGGGSWSNSSAAAYRTQFNNHHYGDYSRPPNWFQRLGLVWRMRREERQRKQEERSRQQQQQRRRASVDATMWSSRNRQSRQHHKNASTSSLVISRTFESLYPTVTAGKTINSSSNNRLNAFAFQTGSPAAPTSAAASSSNKLKNKKMFTSSSSSLFARLSKSKKLIEEDTRQ